VASAHRQGRPAAEVIVVVDHNPPLRERACAELRAATVIPNDGPRGLSGARNTGVAAAGGDVAVFLDDDAVAEEGWLARLLAPYDDQPSVAGVGGRADPVWPAPGSRPRWWPPEFDWVVGCSYQGLPEERARVRNLIGCNMSFRRNVFIRVGAFMPGMGRASAAALPFGCEETDLCIRLTRAYPDAQILYEPAARVRHQVDPARVRWEYFRRRCAAEGRSKALVSRRLGAGDALSSERAHVRVAIAGGLRRDLGAALRQGEVDGARRAFSSVYGLAAAGAGYLAGPRAGAAHTGAASPRPATCTCAPNSSSRRGPTSTGRRWASNWRARP